ncbi:peptide chain release factor N(5)-glutamine methyltransferase [Xanthobacter autotrophicus]|uniref:peptide chain release factor N(5)-glutamine methyltransferase n=1 Tax=Xanthobacter autotrophicus TaxID=280 RepID=UPI00372C7370
MAEALTIGALRRQMAAALAAAGVETPDLDARVLLAQALDCAPGDLLLRADAPVPPEAADAARMLVDRRAAGEPVARIRGRREFWSLDLHLSPETLVPRPDTETLVEAALAERPDRTAPLLILDLGTGTGAILAALLVELANSTGIAVDRSEGAALTARDNFARNGLAGRAHVMVGDWGSALAGGFDLVVSNPPYITASAMLDLPAEVRLHDPHLALEAGADGLVAYRAIAADLPRLLRPGGVAVLELGAGQEPAVAELVAAAGLEMAGPARRDLSGIPRALVARRR